MIKCKKEPEEKDILIEQEISKSFVTKPSTLSFGSAVDSSISGQTKVSRPKINSQALLHKVGAQSMPQKQAKLKHESISVGEKYVTQTAIDLLSKREGNNFLRKHGLLQRLVSDQARYWSKK